MNALGLIYGLPLEMMHFEALVLRVNTCDMKTVSTVSIQDTLYALYTIQHQEPPPKYYKYYIVLNFILYPPICQKMQNYAQKSC